MQQLSIDEVKLIHSTFERDFESLVLSTVSKDGFPHVSYAPYIKIMDDYYVIVSEIAEHYNNLMNGKASVMFIKDELSTSNVFFRDRLSYKCNVMLSTDKEVIAKFTEVHGELVEMLLTKMDFHIFKLSPFIGRIVLGPGKAFTIEGDTFTHVNNRSHKKG